MDADLKQKIDRMKLGNPPEGGLPARDLSMRPKEYWESRRSPAAPHHWTSAEFERHLQLERYPPNTLADRMATHAAGIKLALTRGQYVPPEVMADKVGQESLVDAIVSVKAADYCEKASARQQANSLAFMEAIGANALERREKLYKVLLDAARAPLQAIDANSSGIDRWIVGGYKTVEVEGYPRPLMVCPVAGSDGDRQRIDIRDSSYGPASLFGSVRAVQMPDVASMYSEMIAVGDITVDEVVAMIGADNMPMVERYTIYSSDSAAQRGG